MSKIKALPIIKRTIRYSITSSLIVLTSCVLTGAIVFIHANRYKNDLQTIVKYQTGIEFDYKILKTGFNGINPYIFIDNLTIDDPVHKASFKLNKLRLILSTSSSFTHLAPIFAEINLNGSDLKIVSESNLLTINNYPIVSNNQKSEMGKLILLQQHILIDNINTQIDLPSTIIKDLRITGNSFELTHNHPQNSIIKFKTEIQGNQLVGNINLLADDLLDIRSWHSGDIEIHSTNKHEYLIRLKSHISAGEVDFIHGTLDSNHNYINYSQKLPTLTTASGSLNVKKETHDLWSLSLANVNLASRAGKLIDNLNATGKISRNNGGNITINKFSIEDLGNVINYFESNIKLHTTGLLSTQINWDKKLSAPQNITTLTKLNNINLVSYDKNIPSVNNINALIKTNNSQIDTTISLHNSTINYPTMLLRPLNINLNSQISFNSESPTRINIKNINLYNQDFKLSGEALYLTESQIIDSKLLLSFFDLSKAYKYVPVAVGKQLANDFEGNLSGKMQQIKINIHGNPAKFPFVKSNDEWFKLDGEINGINYLWQAGWPKLSHTNGTLKVQNQNIMFTVNKGNIGNLPIHDGKAQIPNFIDKNSQLIVQGSISAPTMAFVEFAKETPFHDQVNDIESKISITGGAKASLHATIDLNDKSNQKINGSFITMNNVVQLSTDNRIGITNLNSKLEFTQKGLTKGMGTANLIDSPLNFNLSTTEANLFLPNFAFDKLFKDTYPKLESIINGTTNINVKYSKANHNLALHADLADTQINAPAPIGKLSHDPSDLMASYDLATKQLKANLNNTLISQVNLDDNYKLESANIYLGTQNIDNVKLESENKINITVALNETNLKEWANFASNIANSVATTTQPITTSGESFQYVMNTEQIESNYLESDNNDMIKQEAPIYPIGIKWQSNSFWYGNYNLNKGVISAYIYPTLILTQINTPDIEGRIGYTPEDNQVDAHFDRVIIAQDSLYKPESDTDTQIFPENESSVQITPETYAQFESQEMRESADVKNLLTNTPESIALQSTKNNAAASDTPNNIHLPNINFKINSLYVNNAYWGKLRGNIVQRDKDLIIDNTTLTNKAFTTNFNLVNYCFSCSANESHLVIFNAISSINDFGDLMTKAGQMGFTQKGDGLIYVNGSWNGNIDDFNINRLTANASISLHDGNLIKVKPGLFGALMGVVNLSSLDITKITRLSMNSLFGQSFAYNDLTANVYLDNNVLNIEQFYLDSEIGDIDTIGKYNLESQTIDALMTVTPKMDGSIATAAGVITLNPIIGGIVYFAQKALGGPINLLLTTSYHVNGDVNNPTITPTNIGKQFFSNVTSSSSKLLPMNSYSYSQTEQSNNNE